jgi:LysR family transcriptional regulator, glycine cleavage system transcriptional activator
MGQLPSIQTLRAFDAAGRHQSYSRAADELGLTHGAISHRIRELETRTGERLFERRGNRMVPTPEGHRLLAHVRHALALLGNAFSPDAPATQRLTISLLPSVAARWLSPRLAGFRAAQPKVKLELRTEVDLADFRGDDVDGAIRFGPGGWPGVQATRIAGELLFPVCSPAYLACHPLDRPADLAEATLLRNSWQPWAPWFGAAQVDLSEPATGTLYADSDLLLEAAAAGEGVALGRGILAAAELRAGRLVRPFDLAIEDTYAYYLVSPQASHGKPALAAFANWLAGEMTADLDWLTAQLTIR